MKVEYDVLRDLPATAAAARRWRDDFPVLREQVHGKPLVYLDNGATTQKPQTVIDAEVAYYVHDNANVHRAVHALSQRATEGYEAARGKVQRFINAAAAEEIVFVRGTTEAINLVAQSYARPRLKIDDEVIITAMEHHSNIVPWQMVCAQTGAVLKVVPINDTGELEFGAYERALGPRTRIVAVTHVVQPCHQSIDIVTGVVQRERSARGSGNAVTLHQRHCAMVTGANRHAMMIQNRPDIVRMNPFHREGQNARLVLRVSNDSQTRHGRDFPRRVLE